MEFYFQSYPKTQSPGFENVETFSENQQNLSVSALLVLGAMVSNISVSLLVLERLKVCRIPERKQICCPCV